MSRSLLLGALAVGAFAAAFALAKYLQRDSAAGGKPNQAGDSPGNERVDANPPGLAPASILWIPGGEFSMGANDPPEVDDVGMKATLDARPIHRLYVDGFFMDKTDVNNAQFTEFVKSAGYVTVAERKPTAEDFPGAPPENLVAGSVVFSPPGHAVALNDHFQWWSYVKGANSRRPSDRKAIFEAKKIIQ